MSSRDLIGFLGWVTAVSFGIALLNYFMKLINKKFINKLSKEKKPLIDLYRRLMKIVIKYHKLAGIVATLAVLGHFFIAFSSNHIRITGIISAILMIILFFIGAYGAFVNKTRKGLWIKLHRLVAFSLIITIGIHILYK